MPVWEQFSCNDYFQIFFRSKAVLGPHFDGGSWVLAELYVESTRAGRQGEVHSTNMRNGKPAPCAEPQHQFVTAAIIFVRWVLDEVV